jgi:hypothetical protein
MNASNTLFAPLVYECFKTMAHELKQVILRCAAARVAVLNLQFIT